MDANDTHSSGVPDAAAVASAPPVGAEAASDAAVLDEAAPAVRLDLLPRTVELSRDAAGNPCLSYVDERRLPAELVFEHTGDWRAVVDAIKCLAVRGAPAIGVAGAAAVALAAAEYAGQGAAFDARLRQAAAEIADARPTAVNLRWAVDRMLDVAQGVLRGGAPAGFSPELCAARGEVADGRSARDDAALSCAAALFDEAKRMEAEDEAVNRAMGAHGAALLQPSARILTHCNAGSLATVFFGTALGVVYAAAAQGKVARVYADETRPVGQGARLTVWELSRAGIPVTLICDNVAASLMAQGGIDAVIVGADRIAANGDAANKIGTYGLAVLARHHGIPFYVVAPTSTIDVSLADGGGIPIEQRAAAEVADIIPEGVEVWNPAFDVTPASLITAIVTETGVFAPARIADALG